MLIELARTRVLTDPMLTSGILHIRRRQPAPAADELLPLDAILISHAHHDHLDHRSLSLLARQCPVIVPRGCASTLRRTAAPEIIELDEGTRISIGGLTIEAVHAAHDGRRHPFAAPITPLGYVLEGPPNIYFAGDTDLFPGMSALAGRVDVALLPIWGWGARVPAGHLDPARAAQAVARIRPRLAIPIHWGTLRAWGTQHGLDPVAPALAFSDAVTRSTPHTEVRVLMPGQQTAL